jgi:hypothetical protein
MESLFMMSDLKTCDPEESRTPNLLIRSQMLYPIKLRDHRLRWAKVEKKRSLKI